MYQKTPLKTALSTNVFGKRHLITRNISKDADSRIVT